MPILFLILVLFTSSPCSQAPNKVTADKANSDAEAAVLKVTREWLDAEERHDSATLKRIIADDFQGTAAMGHTVFKEDVVPEEGSRSGGLSINTSDMKARIFGDTAVVTAKGVQKAGEKRELRFTVIFTKRNNQWQMVGGHMSAIPKI